MLDRALDLHPQVALRPEPFGALAYHYGNRRLIFLKHPDVVAVVRALGDHPTLQAALDACGIAESRWPAFDRALTSLVESEMLVERAAAVSPTSASHTTVSPTVAGATT
jgi:putative mycofactocin binding protein MftB